MTQAVDFSLSQPVESQGPEHHQQFVVFSLSDQKYCVDIMSVQEIRMVQAITPLPGSAEYVRGIINLRGTIVPVCDLRMRFGLGQTQINSNQTVVIADIQGHVSGLLVDEVIDILKLPVKAISEIPSIDASRRNPYFRGLISQGDDMLIVIDLAQTSQSIGLADVEWNVQMQHAAVG